MSAHLGASGGKQNHLAITTGKQPLVLIGLRDLLYLLDEGGTVLERRARPDVIHQRALATVLCSRALRVQHIGELACEAHILVLALEVHVVRGVVAVVGGLELVAVNDEVVLPSSVTATCSEVGPIIINANEIWTIVDMVAGWTSVTNPEAGFTGVTYEQDAALRARRQNSTIINGTGPVDAIYSALSKLGLEYITIVDNDTKDTIGGQPPGTIQVIVKGGTPSEIALAIYQEKGTGIRTFGSTTQVVTDANGYPKSIKFSRPVDTTVYATVNIKRLKGSSNDASTLVQTACINYLNSTKIGATIVWSDLLSYIAEQVDLISIKSLFIGRTASPTKTDDIELTQTEKAVATTTGVIVNVLA